MKSKHKTCIVCGCEELLALDEYQKDHLVRCLKCGMVFSIEIPSKNDLDELYKSYSYTHFSTISQLNRKRYMKLLLGFEKFRKTNKILDYGCGKGDFLVVAREMGWDVYGYEYSESALHLLSQQNITAIGPNNISDFIEMESFDIIISTEVLEHLIFPLNSIKEIYGMLRKGGCFYMTVPNFNSIGRRRMKAAYPVLAYPEHLSYFTKKSLRLALSMAGFQIEWTRTSGINPLYLKRNRVNSKESENSQICIAEARERFEKPLMNVVKSIINFFLNALQAGETLKSQALKK